MTARTAPKRRIKNVSDARNATKVELVTGALFLIGGDVRFVMLDELALACHRLMPDVFSWPEYSWLPNLDSVRVTIVDAKRAGVIDESTEARGHTLKGIRLSSLGREWAERNAPLLASLRRRLPEPSRYAKRPSAELAAVAVFSAGMVDRAPLVSRERVIAEAYRLFPERFALSNFAGWPDSARVEQAARDSAWIILSPEGWMIHAKHREMVEKLRAALHVENQEGFGASERRQVKGVSQRAVHVVARSPLFKRYRVEPEQLQVSEEDVCDILSVTLESSPETLRKHLESMVRLLETAERWEMVEFLKWLGRWLQERDFKLA
jgi:hypothetical protein